MLAGAAGVEPMVPVKVLSEHPARNMAMAPKTNVGFMAKAPYLRFVRRPDWHCERCSL